MIDATVPSSIPIVISLNDEAAASMKQIFLIAVKIWTFYRAGASDDNFVSAVGTTATQIPGKEKIVSAIFFENERRFQRRITRIFIA